MNFLHEIKSPGESGHVGAKRDVISAMGGSIEWRQVFVPLPHRIV